MPVNVEASCGVASFSASTIARSLAADSDAVVMVTVIFTEAETTVTLTADTSTLLSAAKRSLMSSVTAGV